METGVRDKLARRRQMWWKKGKGELGSVFYGSGGNTSIRKWRVEVKCLASRKHLLVSMFG